MAIESISNTDNGHDSAYPIVTFMPVLTMQDLAKMDEIAPNSQYAIQIGCINESTHVGWDGSVMDYFTLFRLLEKKGYDPLYPIRGEKARMYTGKKIAKIIMSNSKKGDYDKILPQITAYAKQLCEFVREYIYGAMSVPSFGAGGSIRKPPLAKSSIYTRHTREKNNPSLYGGAGGDEEPLFETGNLYDSIKYNVIPVQLSADIRRKISDAAKVREKRRRIDRKRKNIKSAKELRRKESKSEEERQIENRLKKIAKVKRAVRSGRTLSKSMEQTRQEWWERHADMYITRKLILRTGMSVDGRALEDSELSLIRGTVVQMENDMRRLGIDEEYIRSFKS